MKYFVFFVALLLASPVYADSALLDGPSLVVAVSPQYPKPGEMVSLTVQSPVLDLSTRTIWWKNGNTVVSSGEGEATYTFTASDSGQETDISVAVEGVSDVPTVTIIPLTVDLMWESDSYTPGLYQGRHLPSQGSVITLQALPHIRKAGNEIPVSQLIFTWIASGKTILSKKGADSITLPVAAFSQASTVQVSVTTSDKTLGADRTTTIQTIAPILRLYTEHPLYGTMYHNALSTQTEISDTEMSFNAIPYFAAVSGANDKLFSYMWRVNQAAVDANDTRPNTLTINAGAAGGVAQVDLSLTHKKNFQLDAHGTWNINFGSIAGSITPGSDPFTGK